MKRGIFVLFFLVSIFIITTLVVSIDIIGKDINGNVITGNVINKDITGEVITGDATQQVGMSIFVSAYFPLLSIISPGNKTYLTNESLLLNYLVSNEQRVWYNLDNSVNTTITSITYFNTSQGSHILYLYANSSFGNITLRNITFFINSSRFIILDDEFDDVDINDSKIKNKKENKKGQSTDFLNYSYEEIQNLSNVILHDPNKGKIVFNQPINLTDDENVTDGLLDLETNVNISFNRIEINSTALPNFNKPATLEFYNLTFSNPRILRDGNVCSSLICTEESYSGRTLKFNVTGFSVYTSEETPVEVLYTAPGGGSGGGGRTVIPSKELKFEVEPELIEVMIKKGETFKFSIKVKNNGTSTQEFKAEVLYLQDLVSIQNPEFSLKPGEEKEVILVFSPPDSLKEDTYTGKIKISSEGQEKEIPVIFSLKSKIVLFDLTLSIPSDYKEVRPGGEVLFQISIFNLGGGGRTDVEVTYYLRDFEGNTITEQKGVVGVETQASFSRTVNLPKDIKEGQYIIGANARYDHSIGTASDIFYVSKLETSLIKKFIPVTIISLISLIILIILIILLIFYFKRKIKGVSKTYGEELKKIEKTIKKKNFSSSEAAKERLKLQHALRTVEKAYEKRYITKQAYESGKLKIKKADENLKKKCL